MATPSFRLVPYEKFNGIQARIFRHRYGISKRTTIERAGVNPTHYRKWEDGHWRMRPLDSIPGTAVIYKVLIELALERCYALRKDLLQQLHEWEEEVEKLRQEPLE